MAGRWFSPGTPVSSTNKTDRYDIAEILLKVKLNTLTLTQLNVTTPLSYHFFSFHKLVEISHFLPNSILFFFITKLPWKLMVKNVKYEILQSNSFVRKNI
jgi:hypothetical protein